jgi:hypothetical protein
MRTVAVLLLGWLPILSAAVLPATGQRTSVRIDGGPVQLQVTTAPAGQNPPPATDASSTLQYSERRDEPFKVAVSTTAPGQRYGLRVEALDAPSGLSPGEVTLTDNMAPATILYNIDLCDAPGGGPPGGGPPGGGPPGGGGPPQCRAEATLRYRAFVEATDEPGSDSHTVQYTILAQ